MDADLFGRIDDWRRVQLVLMSRLEAIRQLVSMALDAAENGKTKRGN
jgi:hypothetical protein